MKSSDIDLKKLSHAVEQCASVIVITNREGNIEYVNPQFSRLTGYAWDEVIGKNPRLLQSGRTPREKYLHLWSTITTGKDWKGEFLNKKKNGEFYWESASITSIADSKGRITHFVGVFEDITHQKRLAQLKDELLGTVSHEIRTPLGVIRLAADNLLDGLEGPLSEGQKVVIDTIRNNCERLTNMVHDLLDLSRLESENIRLKHRKVDVQRLLQETVQDLQQMSQKRGIEMVLQLPSVLPDIDADPTMIARLITNLLDNALRFARKRVSIEVEADTSFLHVMVGDDGPGIAREDLGKLFNKYEQIKRSGRKGEYQGTGLGLAICKNIVDQHRGRIWVESIVGKGAWFHFVLPILQQGPCSVI